MNNSITANPAAFRRVQVKTFNPAVLVRLVIVLIACMTAPLAFAASQTWTNAPVSPYWTNVNNWIGLAVPGGINLGGTTLNNDTVTFNSPLSGGIGGAGNPIRTDDATATNGVRSRQIGSIVFATANCGAYVIDSASPITTSPTNPDPNVPITGVLFVSHNGGITMSNEVVTSQKIMVPLYTRLPNSTAGIYNFVNNAADPAATLYINAATNYSANTRGTEWRLSGSNTGTNTIGALSRGTSSGTAGHGLTKNGPGTWILPGTNEFLGSGVITINDGLLIVGNDGVFGNSTTLNVLNTGVLQIKDGVNLNQNTIGLRNNGTIRANGTITVRGVAVGNLPGQSVTLATTSASDVLTAGIDTGIFTAANRITGGGLDTVLHVAGPGTVAISQSNSFIGIWSFDAGTAKITTNNTALGQASLATVGAGATFDATALGAVIYTPSAAGFGGRGTGTTAGTTAATVTLDPGATIDLANKAIALTYTPASTSGDTTHPALYVSQGTLSLSGNAFTINNVSAPLGIGTYLLVKQASGSITSGGGYVADVQGNGTAPGTLGTIQVTGGEVNLVVIAYTSKNLTWQGGNPNNTWNNSATANFLDGVTPSIFNPSDAVTFNATGSAYPTVNLVGTLTPGSVTVDTSANDYTFSGSGRIAGSTSVAKVSSGTLSIQTVNTYTGGTVISNGTVTIGTNNAISSSGTSPVSVYGAGKLNLNSLSNVICGLSGDGTVDNQGANPALLTVGNNNSDGTFTGVIKNTSGSLAVTKVGTGLQTLTGANTYSGDTTVNDGTLRVLNVGALGSSSNVVLNGGTLDMGTDLTVNRIAGAAAATIANNSSSSTNTLICTVGGGDIISSIVDGSGGGGIALFVPSGTTNRLSGANTYSGGTILGSGSTLEFGVRNPGGSGSAGTGGILASNGVTVALVSAVSTSDQIPNNISLVDGATAWFTSAQTADQFSGQFIGGPTTTAIFGGNMSLGGGQSFTNFLGTVVFTNLSPNGLRFNSGTSGGGSDNAVFEFRGGNIYCRDSITVHVGLLRGASGSITGPSVTSPATYLIGAMGIDSTFEGFVTGSNNIIKAGAGKLTLDGMPSLTNTVTLQDLSQIQVVITTNVIGYSGTTTISNGVLKVVAPNNLTNSSIVTLAGAGAVLDASVMGSVTYEYVEDFTFSLVPTNSTVITNPVVEVNEGRRLGGNGTIYGTVDARAGSILNPGNPAGVVTSGTDTGTLNITNTITIAGTVNMRINGNNAQAADKLAATGAITVNGGTLNVTNIGPDLITGTVFPLFNKAITGTGFASIVLPTANTNNTITYQWETNITTDGSIKLLAGAEPPPAVDTNPTNITFSVSGGALDLQWPSNHTGWYLQTNTSVANAAGWGDWPNANSTNHVTIPIDPALLNLYFRLTYTNTP